MYYCDTLYTFHPYPELEPRGRGLICYRSMLSINCLPTAHEEIALRIQPLSFVKMISLARLSQKYLLPVTRRYLRIASPVTVISAKLHSSTSLQLELRNIDSNSVVKSPLPDVRVPEINLYNHVFRDAALFGKKIAIVNGETGREYSFAEVEEATCRVSSALNRSGLQKGDVLTGCSQQSRVSCTVPCNTSFWWSRQYE